MGLLDGLFSGGGGGLLDFLRNNAMNQQFGSGLQSDQAQYGNPLGAMAQAPAMQPAPQQSSGPLFQPAPPQQPPMPQAAPQPMPQEASPGGFGAGVNGFISNLHTGPIGALIGGIGSAAGLTDGKTAIARQQANATATYLRKAGVPDEAIAAAVGNGRTPGNPEILKTLLATTVKREAYRPATPEERKAAGVGENGPPMFINAETGEPKFGPAQTNVNVSTEKTGQAELAKTGVESYVAAQNAGRDAQKRVALYDQMERASQGFTPGASAEMKLTAKRYLKDAGLIKGEDVPDGEIMQMISRQLGIHAQPKGQGAVSNYERELFAKSLPNMTQSPEGLKMAIDISRKLEQHDQKVAEIYRESAKSNKGMPNYLEVQEKIAALGSPLSDSHMAAISGGSSAPASPAPSSGSGWTNIGNGVKIRPK
jgi:hypothetical protein